MCDYMCDYIVYYHTFKASCSYKPRSKQVALIMLCFNVFHHVCEYKVKCELWSSGSSEIG